MSCKHLSCLLLCASTLSLLDVLLKYFVYCSYKHHKMKYAVFGVRPICVQLAASASTPPPSRSSSPSVQAPQQPQTALARQLRLAASWQDIARVLSDSTAVLTSEMAFALYRVGCFFCLMSTQHRAGASFFFLRRLQTFCVMLLILTCC